MVEDIQQLYFQQFLPGRNQEWFSGYLEAVTEAANISLSDFRSASFQESLWHAERVSSVGPGSSVVVPGAYNDSEIVDALWALKNWNPPVDLHQKARFLDSEFERILALVCPRHNKRRPSAKLVRIFAVLRPFEIVCLMDARRTTQFRQWLGEPSIGLGFVGQNVIAKSALRDALGPEKDIGDAVSYSQFAWFVWKMISAIDDEVGGSTSSTEGVKATDAPKLVLLPAVMQRKGIFYVADNLQLLMSLVRAAENGIEKPELMQQVAEEAPNLNASSQRNVIAQAIALNLLAVEGGTYKPTATGRGLLEKESPADMLVPALVRKVFGFALILGDLRKEPLERGQIAKKAQAYYPKWTSEFAPNALVAWLRDLGLAEIEGVGRSAKVTLTDVGEYWASGLPENLSAPEHLLANLEPSDTFEAKSDEIEPLLGHGFDSASIESILARFTENPDLRRFVFREEQIRLVHGALHSARNKRFILLAGLSGTGKTSMARSYARAYCEAKGVPHGQHYEQVSVWPDWTDPSGLIGYVNPLADPPVFNQTRALQLLLRANGSPDKPFFLCLDEMNLARVEHYFAPFLSAMEGDAGKLQIHSGDEAIDSIPPEIYWPSNLFIVGTVNMDESTFPFSDKVLDRAFTFEFWDVDLEAWYSKVSEEGSKEILEPVFRALKALNKALVPCRRHFGYRTCDEILGFCKIQTGLPLTVALDTAVQAKVLPKIRGESSGPLTQALVDLVEICKTEQLNNTLIKINQMQETLANSGLVRFWS